MPWRSSETPEMGTFSSELSWVVVLVKRFQIQSRGVHDFGWRKRKGGVEGRVGIKHPIKVFVSPI